MKRISKLLSIILVIVLTLAIIPVSSLTASAGVIAPEIKLVSNTAAANIGEVISVDVSVPKNSRYCNISLDFIYDSTNFEFVEVISKHEFDAEMINTTHTSNSIRFVGTDTTYISDQATTLFTVKLKVLDNCCEMYAIVKEAFIVDENDNNVDVTMDANIVSVPIEIHQPVEENVISLPTCDETGYKTYNCPCGVFVEEHTPATGHIYENRVCVVCGESAPDEVITVVIGEPSITELRAKDGIVLHAIVQGNASGTTVEWTASSDENFDIEASGNDLTIISEKKGYTTFTATVYDSEGNYLSSASVEMYSKAGFFDRIGGFFRALFRTNVIHKY